MLGGEHEGPGPLAQQALSCPESDAGQGQGVLGAGERGAGGGEGPLPGRAHPLTADPRPVPQCPAGESAGLTLGPRWQEPALTLGAPGSIHLQGALPLQGLMGGGSGGSQFTSAGREPQDLSFPTNRFLMFEKHG